MPYYRTSFMLPFRFTEIIYGALFDTKHYFRYDREVIESYDGEKIALDWGSLHAKFEKSENDLDKVPVVMLLPGLSGSSESPYIKASMNSLRPGGFRPVVFNSRGSGIVQESSNIFDYRYTERDLEVAVEHVKRKYPKANIYFMGFSYGSSYGTNVMARNQKDIKGMVCVANPFDMYKAGQSLNSKRNLVYG
jgi:predicted alpha/beta-fold hydrolase